MTKYPVDYNYVFLLEWRDLHALGFKADYSSDRKRVKTIDGEWIRDGVYIDMDIPHRFRLVLRKYGHL